MEVGCAVSMIVWPDWVIVKVGGLPVAKVTGESVIAQCRMFQEKWSIVLGEIPEKI